MKTMLHMLLFIFTLNGVVLGETTASINLTYDGGRYVGNIPGTYASKRDSSTATNVLSVIRVGQLYADTYNIYRGFFKITVPALSSVVACSLYVDGSSDQSTTDYGIYLLTAGSYGEFDKNAYVMFDGRQIGSAHTGSILNNTWNSSSYSADWNVLVFNAAGLDTVAAYAGRDLYLSLISKNDYDNTAPIGSEHVTFSGSSQGYVSLVYTTPPGWSGTIARTTDPSAIGRTDKANIAGVGR